MSQQLLGLIDVGNWQNIVDLATGQDYTDAGFPALSALAAAHPYPGDGDISLNWQKETALALIALHRPQLLHLAYTQPLYAESFAAPDQEAAQARQHRILDDIAEIASAGGYQPLIVFCGGHLPLVEEIRDLGTEGLLESQPWGLSEAGVTMAAAGDEAILRSNPQIKQVISRREILAAHPQAGEDFASYLPDYIINAQPGYAFRGMNCHMPPLTLADICEEQLPVSSAIGLPAHTREVPAMISRALSGGQKVLFAVIEGYDARQIPPGYALMDNCDEWYCYRGLALYLALMIGKPFWQYSLPPVIDRSKPKYSGGCYPMSGFFKDIPQGSIGSLPGITSAAVSSRSMITHMVANADITVECYSRDRAKMGTMIAFKPEKLR